MSGLGLLTLDLPRIEVLGMLLLLLLKDDVLILKPPLLELDEHAW